MIGAFRRLRWLTLVCAVLMAHIGLAAAQIGMVASAPGEVVIFDAATDTYLGAVHLPVDHTSSPVSGDCTISADQSLGFVTDLDGHIWVIDLKTRTLADGINPIEITSSGEDTSLTPDGKYLVVAGTGGFAQVSVIDIESRTEVETLYISGAGSIRSVEVCDDSSVLFSGYTHANVYRFLIDEFGHLTDTGEILVLPNRISNVMCAPGSSTGLAVTRGGGGFLHSFSIPGLQLRDTVNLTGVLGLSGQVSNDGSLVYVRTNPDVNLFGYDPQTGDLSDDPIWIIFADDKEAYFGMEQLALHPYLPKLYVSQVATLEVHDALTSASLDSIPGLPELTGVCIGAVSGSLEKSIVDGPDVDQDGTTDLVVRINQPTSTEYEFNVEYFYPGGPPVQIRDTVPAEWQALLIDDDQGNATIKNANKKKPGKGATKIEWTPIPQAELSEITVGAETRCKKNSKCAPGSCGAFYLNSGAAAYGIDAVTGDILKPALFESNKLCLAAVEDVYVDGIIYDGSGDEDGDGIGDWDEACVYGTDPCVFDADLDEDQVPDSVDNCPVQANPGQVDVDGDGVGAACDCDDHDPVFGEDTEPPAVNCEEDVVMECHETVDEGLLTHPTYSDNCDDDPMVFVASSIQSDSCSEWVERTWWVVDAAGNTAQCGQKVIAPNDEAPPEITFCAEDKTVECGDPLNLVPAVAVDSCSEVVMYSERTEEGGCGDTDPHTEFWGFTDACGNEAVCAQRINVVDTTAPVIECPEDYHGPGPADPGITGEPEVSDTCGDAWIDSYEDSVMSETYIIRHWDAVDACGNLNDCHQDIYLDVEILP